jgi:hypothetical protein
VTSRDHRVEQKRLAKTPQDAPDRQASHCFRRGIKNNRSLEQTRQVPVELKAEGFNSLPLGGKRGNSIALMKRSPPVVAQ